MSPSVLKRLLDQDIVRLLSAEDFKPNDNALYSAGSPASFFTLIIEGCVQVIVGNDGMEFQSRSFSYFGTQALLNTTENPQAEYIPDYTVRPTVDCLVVIITQRQYTAARNATLFGQEQRNVGNDEDSDKEEEGGDSLRTFGEGGVGKSDVFKQEWERAATHDLENSLVSKSGLTRIAWLFKKKPHSKQQVATPDRCRLLTLSSTESEAGSSSSNGASRGDQNHQMEVQISIEDKGTFGGDPLVGMAKEGESNQFRTSGEHPPIEDYTSSPRSYHTTQV